MFAVKAGLRVGQRSLVTLTTGFSISSEEDQPTVVCAHFCPTDGEWQIRETYQEGDKAFRGEIEEAVNLRGLELPMTIPDEGHLTGNFLVEITPEGILLARVGPIRVAGIPDEIFSEYPYCKQSGPAAFRRIGYAKIADYVESEGTVVLN